MNNNENISISKLLAVLDIQDDESFIITNVELIDDKKYLHIQKKLEPVYCPRCGSRMHSKGFYTRKLNHPVLQDSTKFYMIVKQRKWHCDECNLYMNDSFPFLDRYAHSTTITPLLILNEFLLIYNRVVGKMKVVYPFYESVIIKKPKKVNV